jgi:glutathione synthase/RimK-type ligase-like ATP-grasp enzyme
VRSVGIATCRALPDGDEDAALLGDALRDQSIDATWRAWDDPDVDWCGFALTLVRSTWDYTADRDAFLRWAAAVPGLHNAVDVLEWNSDKTYLRELRAAGIPTVDTRWVAPAESVPVPTGEFVVKPTIGAGSKGVGRFDAELDGSIQAAHRHVATLHAARRTVMIQPYLAGVDGVGETALIYVAGVFAHAVTKAAMLRPDSAYSLDRDCAGSLWMPERIELVTASPAELEVGRQVMDFVRSRFGTLVYARVDLLPGPTGPVVIELELIEPSLFLLHHPATAVRLAQTVAESVQ